DRDLDTSGKSGVTARPERMTPRGEIKLGRLDCAAAPKLAEQPPSSRMLTIVSETCRYPCRSLSDQQNPSSVHVPAGQEDAQKHPACLDRPRVRTLQNCGSLSPCQHHAAFARWFARQS